MNILIEDPSVKTGADVSAAYQNGYAAGYDQYPIDHPPVSQAGVYYMRNDSSATFEAKRFRNPGNVLQEQVSVPPNAEVLFQMGQNDYVENVSGVLSTPLIVSNFNDVYSPYYDEYTYSSSDPLDVGVQITDANFRYILVKNA